MKTPHTDRPPDTPHLVRRLIPGSASSISMDQLVSGWMADFSAQLLFEQLDPMLLRGELALVHDPEGTRLSLGDSSPHGRSTWCRSDCLTEGEVMEFAAAVSKVNRSELDAVEAHRQSWPVRVPQRRSLELVRGL